MEMSTNNKKNSAVYKECRFIKANGLKCQSPAMRGSCFCYFHARKHVYVARPSARDRAIELPPLQNEASIHAALDQILHAVATGTLDEQRAGKLLYALQLAQKTIYSAPFVQPTPPPLSDC